MAVAEYEFPRMDKPTPYGRYELLEPIGVGGMAEVYRARLPGVAGFEKPVVIKRLQAKFRNDPRFKRMFVEEAKLASQVQHKNVVQVFELGHHDGELYMVLEYIPGTDLKKLFREASLKRLTLPVWLSVHIAIEVLEALSFAHDLRNAEGQRRNLVHCDVTPENIFMSAGGEVKLGDFGVAHDETRAEDDFPGEIRGKLAYMSPEQLSGRPVDQRADVFSAAVVLWEALSHRRLFRGPTDDETVTRICNEDRARPSLYNSRVPASLDDVVLSALRADRTRRTRTAREFQRALVDVQIELRHRVALVDVERALRKILTAQPPNVDRSRVADQDPSKVPTLESEIPSEDTGAALEPPPRADVDWPTMPPPMDPFAQLPEPERRDRGAEPTGSSWAVSSNTHDRLPVGAAVTLPNRTSLPSRPVPDRTRIRTEPEPEAPPASLAAGWTAALTGAEPPRLPPGYSTASVEPSPLAVAPIRGGTSQVETADILKAPMPRNTPLPALRTSGLPSPRSIPVPSRAELATDRAQDASSSDPGIWLRRPGSAETGPRPVPDALTVLRRLLLDSPVLDAEVSVDGGSWRQGTLLARLLGEEVVSAEGTLPETEDRGNLQSSSLVSIFGRLSRRRQSGRLIVVVERHGRPDRYELHVHRGRLFHVASSRSLLAAWRSLLCSPQVEQSQLRAWVAQVIDQCQPFELVAAAPVVEAVRAQQAHFAQDDLQTLFSERAGRYAFAAHPSPPSPNGSGHALLTLIPSLISRSCRTSDLERRLLSRLATPMYRSPDFDAEAGQLGLSWRDAAALERFVSGAPLSRALADPSNPRERKLTLVLAYTLSELGLLRPQLAVSS